MTSGPQSTLKVKELRRVGLAIWVRNEKDQHYLENILSSRNLKLVICIYNVLF